MDYTTVLPLCGKLQQKMVKHRRIIHSFAETGFDTFKTTEYIKNQLSSLGIDSKTICENTVAADIYGKQGKNAFLLRCDIDALPIKEETGLDFACKTGTMHACGHDMHAAMLLGCAELLQDNKKEFYGKATLLFQPAEELLQGAKKVIDSGFDLSCYDGAMTVHVISPCKSKVGSVIIPKHGINAPSADFFEIKVMGKGCHGSSPWLGKNPIIPLSEIVSSLNVIATHEISSSQFTLTVASINAGKGCNVIPDTAILQGSLRTFDEKIRAFAKKRIIEISQGISQSFGSKATVNFYGGCPCLETSKELTERILPVFRTVLGKDMVIVPENDMNTSLKGSEDFSYFSEKIPALSVAIPSGVDGNENSHQMHSSKVLFNEDSLSVGCAVYSSCALEFLKEN